LEFGISINGKKFPISEFTKNGNKFPTILDSKLFFHFLYFLGMSHPFPLKQNTVLGIRSFPRTGLDEISINLPPIPKWPP